ncbi:hypothetical protein [Bosea sp. RAC05]|uniref:hypothetical protein n=1 Tax=Bosea sp. RAC05 TaxID=1842539 RepID=UPI0012375558|nr:hypothetical protein [Bosea sp. RAC05]
MQRWRCICGHVHADPPPQIEHEALEHISHLAISRGIDGAAAALSCPEKTVDKALSRWVDIHCETEHRLADITLALGFSTAGRQRIMLADADDGSLVEVLEDRATLKEWASKAEGSATHVFVEFDGRSLIEVREAFGAAVPAMAVSEARRAVRQVAAKSFMAARTAAIAAGANSRIDPDLFDTDANVLSADDTEAIWAWPNALQALLSAKNMLLDALKLDAGAERNALFRLAETTLNNGSAGAGLQRFLVAWRDVIEAGLALRWVDEPWRVMTRLKDAILSARPRAAGSVLRAILLIETPATEPAPGLTLSMDSFDRPVGKRLLEDAVQTVASFMARDENAGRIGSCSAR